jgi:restriction endonuclease S subunit
MNSYNISSSLNPDKVFVLQKSKIEKRLDPLYYSKNVFGFLKTTKHKAHSLYDLVNYTIAGFGVGKEEQDLTEKGYIQIRPTNLDEFGLLKFNRNVYLGKEYLETKKNSIIQRNDVLFNNTNSQDLVGKTAFFDLEGIYFHSNHITRISANEEKILPKFLWILLNIYQQKNIFYTICTNWNNQSGVGLELLNSLKILVPSIEIQQQVINIHGTSLLLKQQNETEAEKLLASIDDYLLSELGIKLPEPLANTLKNRFFTTSIKSISGNRFDSFYHQKKFRDNIQAIVNGTYPTKQIRDIIQGPIVKGTLPKSDEKDGKNSVIQINCIHTDGTIDLDDLLTAKDIFYKSQKLNNGDILVVITGATIGKTSLWNYEGEYFLGGDIVKFQTKENVNSFYVFNFLRCPFSQIEIKRNVTGATNGHLSPEDVANLLIPIPPIDKQKEIADHITQIRQQAQQLKDKTKEALAEANQQIEKILLG